MTEMIVTERNTYSETESAHCHTVDKEMARCTQGVGKVYPRCTQALGKLMSMLRSSLGAGKEQPRVWLEAAWSITLLLALMTFGATNALALTTDYSGTYYIASVSKRSEGKDNNYTYNINNPANNYYLCPTEGWCSYQATNDFAAGDNGQPFLTTYKCRDGVYDDATKAIWVIEKAPNTEFYYIKQWKTGKYLVSSGQINTAGIDRMRVHLESIADPVAAGDIVLFDISLNSKSQIVFSPQGIKETGKHENFDHSTHRWLTVNDGNYNNLQGHSGKGGGPTGYTNTSGVLGIFNKDDANAPLYLEDARVARPTFSMNDAGDVTITVPAGTTVHYTLDGTDPTAESATYSSVILAANISAGQTVKAIAVPNAPTDKLPSVVATLPLITYHIVNKSNAIAVSSSAIRQLAGTTLSIPEELRSPYISDETITFYTMEGDFDASKLDNEHILTTGTPDESANIYVTYSTTNLANKNKFLHLQMARPMNLKYENPTSTWKYLYEDNGNISYDASDAATITTNNHLWYIGGRDVPDPYDVLVKNSTKTTNLQYASSTFSLGAGGESYVLTGDTDVDGVHHNITLKNFTSGESFTIQVNTVEIPTSYYLIDKKGKQIFGPKESTSDLMIIPSEWSSPLATYHYWKSSSFEETSSGTYILKEGQVELTGLAELGKNEHVYITYDVKDDIDLDGRDLLNKRGGALGATYRLKFTDGTTFKQENGKDGINNDATKAVYPYSNGDASLYVYGEAQWTTQLASGASTRSRWLWYLEPAKDVLDPYHVRVSSYQSQTNYKDPTTNEVVTNFHSYLRTYKPEGYSGVVTGVTNNNPEAQGKAASATAETDLPAGSEYMLLGTDLNNLKLVTVDAIDGSRRTVNSFEQYWKNSPTVQGKLTTKVTTAGRDVTLSDAQKNEIAAFDTNIPWHVYKEYANSAPWMHNNDANHTTSKKFLKEEHAYQTISMGETFSLEETAIDPMLILLDQHGWEIARVRLPSGPDDPKRAERYAAIHKYSSPMVKAYHYYKTASKEPGYHKYKVDLESHATEKDDPTKEYTSEALGVLVDNVGNLPDYGTQALVGGKERDWYVTYDVKPEFASAYTGAATKGETSSVPYLVKQGGKYARINGTSLETEETEPNIENVPQYLRWYVKPNFDIDEEMGYLYAGETDAQEEAESKDATEAAYYAAGKNGFDPYNVQIQSVLNTDRYFTANTTGSIVTSSWEGTSTSISLLNMGVKQSGVMGLDQTHMKITNATFMVLDDGNGNMRLVPRFDNTKVMQNFTTLAAPGEAAAADDKGVSSQTIFLTKVPEVVNNSSEITVMGGTYLLSSSFSATGSIGTKEAPFRGTIEGLIGSSFDVSAPFIAYAEDAVIKNVIIESSSVSSGNDDGHAGAIVATATGNTRIYNCGVNGGSVSGSNYVGGIVGLLDGSARVINCYSYADITGGSTVGGIVGYNNVEGSNAANLKTMVMNCMFYGNITSGNKAPIYNGKIISNKDANGLGNYNYFLAEKPYVQNNQIDTYNCALMAEERFLNRFEFFRLLMNSHLELAGWYATGEYSKDQMMKWVLETADRNNHNPKPYPVLKAPGKYPSIINYDADNAPTLTLVNGKPNEDDRNKGGKFGTLTVNIQMGNGAVYERPSGAAITTPQLLLNITDKDPDHFNFNYYKVQLPYYNDVGTKNYTGNRVVAGWKIVSISGGTAGSFITGKADATTEADGSIKEAPYNFADRKCTNKDLYGTGGSNRIFNQGAYWDVPEGVTAITIEPYWAKCVYLADPNADKVYNTVMESGYDVPNVGGGEIYKNGNSYPIAGENQVVYTTMGNAIASSGTALFSGGDANSHSVYDYAVVLVGNYHHYNSIEASKAKPYTVTSIDLDGDNEPDYSYMLRFNGRTECHPVRTDFINIPGLGMAQKSTGGTGSYNFGIMIPKGWFEGTNTSLFRFTQFEYENSARSETDALILQGGVMEQWVSYNQKGRSNKIPYIHVGGNVWFKEFHTGCHQDKNQTSGGNRFQPTKHSPISVTGGDFDEFYLTGLYVANAGLDNYADNAECYINGGRFGTVCGAAMEGIGKADGANNTGNIVWQIQDADIHEFYAGGLNAAKPVTGNLSTTITDSYVDIFCGGPKFGDMSANKTVHTKATGCTFGTYFGAGYGGNSYSRYAPSNQNNVTNIEWNNWLTGQYKQDYNATYGGVSTQFTYQFLPMSDNKTNVARILIDFVKFSLATTRNVTSNLTGCTVTGNFYGGGSLGKVDGNVTSTLNNCNVKGSAFGAGFSASLPTVEVDAIGFEAEAEPLYYEATGTYRKGVKKPTTTYTWQQANTVDKTANAIDKTNHILYTTEDLTTLGTVTGKATLNITGNTLVEGFVFDASGNPTTQTGGVFGGGDASAALGDTEVNINATSQQADKTYNAYNVFGGGNVASVGGTTTVNVNNGTVSQRVFGGGNEADVNTNANVVMSGGTVLQGVYGGCNTEGTIGGNTTVTLTGGTVGSNWGETAPNPLPDVVFGGGLGEPTLVSGDVIVNIGREKTGSESDHTGTAIVWGNVYGGSALGNTNATKPADALVFDATKKTDVNLYAGTINGNVFGGGLGRKAAAADPEHGTEAVTAVESFVGGDVNVLLDGAKFVQTFTGEGENRMPLTAQIFGANNLNGTPKGHVKVQVERTVNTDDEKNALKNNSETALEARTTYDVTAVYGGGNQADYIPVDPTPETQLNDTEDYAEVIIRGCGATSIEYVYGGGNAAAVPATQVTVESAYIIHQLFGGGNGKSTATFTNPGANVGSYNNGETEYGTGETKIELIGGQVHEVYGGSNTLGNVRGGTSLKRKDSNTCTLKIGAIYGAGQEAPMDGDVNIILECMPKEYVAQVFGGAKNATINGNVSLTVTSGKYGQVFGGNNIGGSINGSITVNVYEDGCEPLIIGELYGGGYNAPYSIWGCNDEDGDGTWTPNTPAGNPHVPETDNAISVNVFSCTSVGKVFGGGFGAPAKVVGNTHVWINTMQGIVSGKKQKYSTEPDVLIGKIGQVYGGGNAAPIKGDVTIDIGTATVNKEHSTGEDAENIGVRIIDGTDYLDATSNTTTSITAGIYGGGFSADVDGNVTLNIGTVNQNQGINIGGDIFGGGFGATTHVTGNVVVNIGKRTNTALEGDPVYAYEGYANITGDVYGGSAQGKVNSHLVESVETATDGKTTHVNFYGGTIKDADTPIGKGNIYGGGLGDANHAADVYGPVTVTMEKGSTNTTVNNVFGCNNVLGTPKNTVTVNINGGTVNNSVYGGGNQAAYTPTVELAENAKIYPAVNINNGTITENVFGGGLGTTATVTGNPHVTMTGGDVKKSVYGGGSLATVDGSTNIVVNSGTIGTEDEGGATYGNVYGGGFGSDENVRIGLVKGNTEVTVNGGTILHNVYGGGAYGSVGTYTYTTNNANAVIGTHTENTGKATIKIKGGTIGVDGNNNGMVFGSSRGDIDAIGAIQDNMAWVYDTDVQIGIENDQTSGPTIHGSLYGGGENGHVFNDASVTMYSGTVGNMKEFYAYRGNVYGGGCGTDLYYSNPTEVENPHDGNGDKYNPKAGIVHHNATVLIKGGNIANNVYGAGSMGRVEGSTSVTIDTNGAIGVDGNHDDGNVYGAARGELNLKENNHIRTEDNPDDFSSVMHSSVEIKNGTVKGNVFGGGKAGIVKGNVDVKVSGGVIINDVYGGGALANTNTENWSTSASATTYEEVTGLTPATYAEESVESGKSVEGLYIKEGDKYVAATGTAQSGTKYYKLTAGSSVAGYYTRSGSEEPFVYTLVTTGVAESGTKYWRKKVSGTWAEGRNDPSTGTTYKTNVKLTGGLVGNVYGGGLGQLANGDNPEAAGYKPAIAAMVYGDVKITVNDPSAIGTDPGVAFTQNTTTITYGVGDKRKEYVIPLTGRVFGCNNQNGTPTGNVRVEVYSTRQIDANNNIIPGHGSSNRKYPNEMRAVYGGGNLSDYLPADGKGTSVYIEGCDVTSIEKVYGGGNSASVPATDVTIHSCYDIGYAFGGGNGGDLIYKNGVWIENEGAIVIGLAKITPKGGKIGQVFGGSDAKGVCGSTAVDLQKQSESTCALVLTRIYGAGNEADVTGDVDMIISGCGSGSQTIGGETVNTQIEYVYGGSYNAHITGHVNLTISSGLFKYVYGGNDRTGSIGGNITVNIEERDNCNPIIIENLLGGGNEAAYPGTRRDGTEITTAGKITVNVKSATYIGSVYGGSYKADVNGDTEVNINMTKGLWAGAQAPAGHSDLPNINHASYAKVVSPTTDNISNYYEKSGDNYTKTSDTEVNSSKTYYVAVDANTDVIDDAVGVIGTVYGGGNQGVVRGSSVVNIGTSTTVPVIDVVTTDAKGKITNIAYKNATVLGARITGDVFGGGNEANVNKNATVNICTVDHSGTAGFEGINIEGGSVYGGGNRSEVLGNTNVTMRGGYVFDGVYGGGLHGSVGTVTGRELPTGHPAHEGCVGGRPTAFAANTGTCTVVVSGGQVGPVEVAKADGGMKNTARYFKDPNDLNDVGPVDVGFVFGAGRGEVEDPAVDKDADFRTFVNETYVTISGGLVMASVYGGGENGRVLHDTHVTISGGQIGCGEGQVDENGKPKPYTEIQWTGENASDFTECASWDYGEDTNSDGKIDSYNCWPYDPYASNTDPEARKVATDGHTYYGSVFGGGSGYFPYKKADGTHEWLRSAGTVYGNTNVTITGGHILTSVYGGNEVTDVEGKCTITMSGGTIGVPRTLAQIAAHPVTCYLFGAGKGDQRTHFNTWTNVQETIVNVSGNTRIFGSVFGGGEDGHVLGNAAVNIGDVTIDATSYDGANVKIGTWGTSYVDGNVFGGGRGFSGEALTAGTVGGNTDVKITGGTMLGSVYGGGRLASVGLFFTDPEDEKYGQLHDDAGDNKYGHITINISGGTIGGGREGSAADKAAGYCDITHSGNVFGGSMGRLKLLDNTTFNPLWPELAQAEKTAITISGTADIKRCRHRFWRRSQRQRVWWRLWQR